VRQKTEKPKRTEKSKLAVALRYRPNENRAPKVAAKGAGTLAEKILQIARENEIPVREDRNLVQVLSRLDLNEEIQPELYQVVARILAFVYQTAHSFQQEMAHGYIELGDQRRERQDSDGARRSWETAHRIYTELGLSGEAEVLRQKINGLRV